MQWETITEYTPRTVNYPPDAVLTVEEVAAWLGVSEKSVSRYGIKRIKLGGRTTRYLAEDVYAYLRAKAA